MEPMKQQQPQPQPTKKPEGRPEVIAVKEIRFSRPNGLEVYIPSPHGGPISQPTQISAGKKGDGSSIAIEYRPWMRHHAVTFRAGDKAAEKVFYIHESFVSAWEPV